MLWRSGVVGIAGGRLREVTCHRSVGRSSHRYPISPVAGAKWITVIGHTTPCNLSAPAAQAAQSPPPVLVGSALHSRPPAPESSLLRTEAMARLLNSWTMLAPIAAAAMLALTAALGEQTWLLVGCGAAIIAAVLAAETMPR